MTNITSQIGDRLRALPARLWIILGVAGMLIIALIVLALVLLLPAGGYTVLNDSRPSVYHPDGLEVRLPEGGGSLRVRIEDVPREEFLAGAADAEWTPALEALPDYVTPLSPVYTIRVRGNGDLEARIAIPADAEPALLDVYRWDEEGGQWVFVPVRPDEAGKGFVFEVDGPAMSVLAARTGPVSPAVRVVVSEGGPDLGPEYGLAIPEGAYINEAGEISGSPVPASGSTVLPLVENRRGGFTAYGDPAQQETIIERLVTLAADYDGLALDFDNGEGYADFVAALAAQLHEQGKQLHVIVRGLSPENYELTRLGQSADRVWLAPGDNPLDYLPEGAVRAALAELVQRVHRIKAGLLVNGLSVDVSGDEVTPISQEDALTLFGDVEPIEGYFDPATPLTPGSELPLRLTGRIESMGFDAPLGMNYLTYHDDAGELHHVYLATPQSLSRKLAWARYYGLGAVAVYGLAHPDAPDNLADGLSAFLSEQPLSDPPALALVWRVQSSSGANLSETEGDLSLLQYLWEAVSEPGQYVISALLSEPGREEEIGQVAVEVAEQVSTPEPEDEPTPTATPVPEEQEQEENAPTPEPTPVVVPSTIAAGAFELGGQTHTLEHPDLMHYAGMTWVKFQHKWGPGDDPAGTVGGRIQQAHALGFKVLLSIPGGEYPESIDYDAYVNYLAGVAALGPDAIEVWNEMNFNREWPPNEIGGDVYVQRMLAPAYQAIKAVNPNVMVISGAPTPTGAFNGCGSIGDIVGCDDWFYISQMRDAGAANYLDCVGVHYNEGIIPPSQRSGDPRAYGDFYSRYFFGMVDLYYGTFGRPLCFTELGYASPEGYPGLPESFSWAADTSVAEQAAWLAEAAVLASQSGKVRLMIVFSVDITAYGSDPQGAYAIIRPDGSCPACDALNAVQP